MPIVGQFGSLAGLGSMILPGGAFESLATIVVGSGGASSIEFTSIPGTYQHLQLRFIARSNRSNSLEYGKLRLNADSGSNYRYHYLLGDGSSAAAGTGATTFIDTGYMAGNTATASAFGATVIDILDYANTSKNTVVRIFGGFDNNGSGYANIYSGLWLNTNAVDTLTLLPGLGANFNQYAQASLYGVRS
jgi:hypothetical protein